MTLLEFSKAHSLPNTAEASKQKVQCVQFLNEHIIYCADISGKPTARKEDEYW